MDPCWECRSHQQRSLHQRHPANALVQNPPFIWLHGGERRKAKDMICSNSCVEVAVFVSKCPWALANQSTIRLYGKLFFPNWSNCLEIRFPRPFTDLGPVVSTWSPSATPFWFGGDHPEKTSRLSHLQCQATWSGCECWSGPPPLRLPRIRRVRFFMIFGSTPGWWEKTQIPNKTARSVMAVPFPQY